MMRSALLGFLKLITTAVLCLGAVSTHPLLADEEGTKTASEKPRNQPSSPKSKDSIHKGANKQERMSKIGFAVNITAGGLFASKCSPEKFYYCKMAWDSFKQAESHLRESKQAQGVAFDSSSFDWKPSDFNYEPGEYDTVDGGGAISGDGTKPSRGGAGGGGRSAFDEIQKNLKSLEEKGFIVNEEEGTVSTPEGEVPLESFNSAAGMASMGMSPSEIQAVRKATEEINKKVMKKYGNLPKVVSMGVSSGGGGYSYGTKSYSLDSGEDNSYQNYLNALKDKMNKKNRAKAMAGKARMIAGDEAIGVKVDNIFDMVHRRYQQKRKANEFIEDMSPKAGSSN